MIPIKTERDEVIAIIEKIALIPNIFGIVLLLIIKKGEISNIVIAKSFVSQWKPVGGGLWKNKDDALYSKLSWETLEKIDAHFEYLDIGIWKAVKDSNKAIIISIVNITVSTLNKVSSLFIVLVKKIIDNDNKEPQAI